MYCKDGGLFADVLTLTIDVILDQFDLQDLLFVESDSR